VLGLSMRADEAAARLFRNGKIAGTVLESDKPLSEQAAHNLRASIEEMHAGAQNAHRTLVLEEGLKFKEVGSSGRDLQGVESRKHQIEEIAGLRRAASVADARRHELGQRHRAARHLLRPICLAPWFACWEQAVSRALLTPAERRAGYYPKFNERALLRGSMKDQAEFLSKLSGAGGGAADHRTERSARLARPSGACGRRRPRPRDRREDRRMPRPGKIKLTRAAR
jgi:HK97 family phage portal protein